MSSSEQLKILVRKRSSLKSKLTLFKNFMDAFVDSNPDITVVNKENILELELRLTRQEPILQDFEEVQTLIEGLDEKEEEHIAERTSFTDSYFKSLVLGKTIISNFYDKKVENSVHGSESGRSSPSSVLAVQSGSAMQNIRLPQIQLPKFSGTYENWLEFRDTFDSLINQNTLIDDIQKFHYLRASLENGAAQIIRALEFSASNYHVAWQSLLQRYNNDSLLVYNHVKSVFSIQNITKESPHELRKLLDVATKHLRSLEALGQPVEHWDTILIYLLSNKLDKVTAREWEEHKAQVINNTNAESKMPNFEEFKAFIKSKADLLETLSLTKGSKDKVENSYHSTSWNKNVKSHSCAFCKDKNHYIQTCPDFLKLAVTERMEQVKRLKLCINCLKANHVSKYCFAGHCRKCNTKHNTLIHVDKRTTDYTPSPSTMLTKESNVTQLSNSLVNYSSQSVQEKGQVLLSTALVQVKDSSGQFQVCRVLLDSGSQSHFVTNDLCERIGLTKSKIKMSVIGINRITSNITSKCLITIQSLHNAFQSTISCLVLPHINDCLPQKPVSCLAFQIPSNIKLADPGFGKSDKIDLLLGAPIFYNLLCTGQIRLGTNMPILQKTLLGWVVSGPVGHNKMLQTHCNFVTSSDCVDIQNQLRMFWEIEDGFQTSSSSSSLWSDEENFCEETFQKTTSRDSQGRFVVQIPLNEPITKLGNSRRKALSRLHSVESKLNNNPTLKTLYLDFMEEYENLGHMIRVSESPNFSYFLPHHGVLNKKNQTTKLRVVFDGSSQTDSGFSFNDIQCVGPKIQDDLINILLRFRQHPIIICADIVKMYRQILVDPSQRALQQILWRKYPNEDVHIYQLCTVSYGTASAPWLAVRCLQQLAKDNVENFPQASKVISRDFYMDDLLTGCETSGEAVQLCDDISYILSSAGFCLQKWASNSTEVLEHVQTTSPSVILKLGEQQGTKILGLYWSCSSDVLLYHIGNERQSTLISKRSILSDVSQIFDPLGLLGPSVILGKIILQKLWMLNLSWDESVPLDLHEQWSKFKQHLPELMKLQIPRWISCHNSIKKELHGFCDASLQAYGACVYMRTENSLGFVQIRLLCAKSRVAPLKSLTIPRLELCGALLLAQLVSKVKSAMVYFDENLFWSDSTICLSWIKTQPNLLKTFVQNRVSQIQSLTEPGQWNHIRSKDNPADILSRGILPRELLDMSLWWSGPEWLGKHRDEWSWQDFHYSKDIPEMRKQNIVTLKVVNSSECFSITKFSTLNKGQRVLAYCFRFISNCRVSLNKRKFSCLSSTEINDSLKRLVKMSQVESFPEEYIALINDKPLSKKSKLLNLNAFLDREGIIRVGGRLQLSDFEFEKKHPAILCSKNYLTKLIFRSEHLRLLHVGPQQLLFAIRERFWPLSGRNLAKITVHSCVKCFRLKPTQSTPIMGILPKARVNPAPVFHTTGIDYAGPILIKDRKGRGAKTSKAYICLFVCFTTKCIHLELVCDLTKEAFIAAFRRFAARRGKPTTVYSDNGTNFVSANAELKELAQFLMNNQSELEENISNIGVDWHFIPAFSPHFGGIWEAGVKSTKAHLKRVMGNTVLTFEELYTILTEIEAILNSRPMTPLSSDPSDLSALTPSHFLLGRPVTSLPDPNLRNLQLSRLSRYQLLQQIQQHFWARWSLEYISELQTRTKWKINQGFLELGSLVVIKEDHTPPLQWRLGRIISLHHGPDGVPRVAVIKTSTGCVKRAFSKICKLPIDVSDDVDVQERDRNKD